MIYGKKETQKWKKNGRAKMIITCQPGETGREERERTKVNSSIWKMETGRSVNRTLLQLHITFEADLGYTRHCIRQRETKQKIS